MSCDLYKHNVPSLIIEKHHVIPVSWWVAAGLMVNSPIKSLCPTCHMNTHWVMDQLIKNGADQQYNSGYVTGRAVIPPRAWRLAEEGIRLGKAAGLTPRRTL